MLPSTFQFSFKNRFCETWRGVNVEVIVSDVIIKLEMDDLATAGHDLLMALSQQENSCFDVQRKPLKWRHAVA
jgi:hypothetical protein